MRFGEGKMALVPTMLLAVANAQPARPNGLRVLGHPAHAALAAFPLALLISATAGHTVPAPSAGTKATMKVAPVKKSTWGTRAMR